MQRFFLSYRLLPIVLLILIVTAVGSPILAQSNTEPVFTLTVANSSASSARWNADQTQLMTWGRLFPDANTAEMHIQIWDANTGDLLLALQQEGLATLSDDTASWNADETLLLTSAGFSAWLWDAETGEPLREFRHERGIRGVHWNSDETQLLTWISDAIFIWDADTGEVLQQFTFPQDAERHREFDQVLWRNDDSQVFAKTFRGFVLWDAETGDVMTHYVTDAFLGDSAFNHEMNQLVFGTNEGDVYIWSFPDGDITLLGSVVAGASEIDWNPDQTLIAVRARDMSSLENGFVYVWDIQSGSQLHAFPHVERAECCISWHPDGNLLLSHDSAIVYVWDTTSGELVYELPFISAGVIWNSDATQFVAWNTSNAQVWDTDTGEGILLIEGGGRKAYWNPDGTQLLLTTTENTASLWQVSE